MPTAKIKNAAKELEKPDRPLPVWVSGMIAKGTTTVVGAVAKAGKTAIAFEIAEALNEARPLFTRPEWTPPSPARVLMCDAELGDWGFEDRLRRRYTRQGIKPPPHFWFVCNPSEMFLDGLGWQKLADMVKEVRPDVVIIDPASHFISEGKNKNIRDLFTNLKRVRTATGRPDLAFIINHHVRKPSTGRDALLEDPLDFMNLRDGSNWGADADGILMLANKRDLHGKGGVRWTLDGRFTFRHFAPPEDFKVYVMLDWSVQVKIPKSGGTSNLIAMMGKEKK